MKSKYNFELLKQLSEQYGFKIFNKEDEKFNYKSLIKGTCVFEGCDKIFEKVFNNVIKYESYYCEECTQKVRIEKYEQKCLEKYGVPNPNQVEDVRQKYENTMIEKYGVPTPLKNPSIEEKRIKTNMEKYGVDNPLKNPSIEEKRIKTNIERYGAGNAMEAKNDEEKQEINKKREKTMMNKSDDEKKEMLEKRQATCFKKYGVKNPMQNAVISQKCGKNAFKLKQYVLPSGKIINLQGYEHHCIYDLIKKENINESDILNERADVPEIWYKDQNNVERRHFVDFFIKSLNKMIEVKSEWTLSIAEEKIFLKQKAAHQLGYDYEIRVYSEKGKLLKTYS